MIFDRLKKLFGFRDDSLLHDDQRTLQINTGAQLREAAIDHLENSDAVCARTFRGESIASGLGHYRRFTQKQRLNGQWATYIEGVALAEKLGVNFTVTPIKEGVQQKPICLYRAADPNAPTVHLYNSNNNHWYVNSQTMGDGNCLYNAFAQSLQSTCRKEAGLTPQPVHSQVAAERGFFGQTNTQEAAISLQRNIAAAVMKAPTPAQREVDFQSERARISQLSSAEQKQIQEDYKLALKLAREELSYVKPQQLFASTRCAAIENTFSAQHSPTAVY
jgi:hypothetical protein